MSDSDCTVQLPVPAHICMKETSFPLNEFTVGTFSNMLLFDSSKKIPVSVLSIKAIPGPMSGRHNEVTPNQTLVEHSVVWQYARVCVCVQPLCNNQKIMFILLIIQVSCYHCSLSYFSLQFT